MTTAAAEDQDPTAVDPTVEADQDPMRPQDPMGPRDPMGQAEDPGPADSSNGVARTLNA